MSLKHNFMRLLSYLRDLYKIINSSSFLMELFLLNDKMNLIINILEYYLEIVY